MSRYRRTTGLLVALLGAGVAVASMLGPLVFDVLRYRTSDTTVNQVMGGDLAGLVVVAPTALVAGAMLWRGHHAGPVVALAPALWAVYMYAQLIVGQEYLQLPGNNERFFPLLLALFVTGEAVAVLAWRAVDAGRLPALPQRLERTAGVVLLVLAAFLVVGLHLPSLVDAMAVEPTSIEYTSSPTAFWIVKLMDLGIIVPAAVVIGVGLLRGAVWARKAGYAIFGGYTLLAAAVAGMAVVMYVSADPDASLVNVAAFSGFTVAIGWLTARLYRPLFTTPRPAAGDAGSALPVDGEHADRSEVVGSWRRATQLER
jgi:hypothetical protein